MTRKWSLLFHFFEISFWRYEAVQSVNFGKLSALTSPWIVAAVLTLISPGGSMDLLFSPPAGQQEVWIQCNLYIYFFKASTAIQLFTVFLLLSLHNQFPLPAALCSLTLISPQSALCSAQKYELHRRLFGGYTAMEVAARRHSDQHIPAEIELIFRRRDPSRSGWKPEPHAMKKNLWKLTSQCL